MAQPHLPIYKNLTVYFIAIAVIIIVMGNLLPFLKMEKNHLINYPDLVIIDTAPAFNQFNKEQLQNALMTYYVHKQPIPTWYARRITITKTTPSIYNKNSSKNYLLEIRTWFNIKVEEIIISDDFIQLLPKPLVYQPTQQTP